MKKTTLIICDDHPIFRKGLTDIIEQVESLELLGECGDGDSAIKLIKDQKPDIAVLDISMPEKDGLEVARFLLSEEPGTRIVILTMYKEEEFFEAAMDAGVKGYLLKDNAVSDLLACISAVSDGHYYVSSLLSDLLIKREKSIKKLKDEIPAIEKLTDMERKVLRLIAKNKTSKEIAGELYISHRTVQNHRQHISDKLNLHGPHKLLQFALENKSLI